MAQPQPRPASLPEPEHWSRLRRWLQPGMAVKRWVLVYLVALTLVALGMALMLTHLYRTAPFPEPVYYVTLQFVPRLPRGMLLVLARRRPDGLGHLEAGGHVRRRAPAPLPLPRTPSRAHRPRRGPVGAAHPQPWAAGGGHRRGHRALHPAAGPQALTRAT